MFGNAKENLKAATLEFHLLSGRFNHAYKSFKDAFSDTQNAIDGMVDEMEKMLDKKNFFCRIVLHVMEHLVSKQSNLQTLLKERYKSCNNMDEELTKTISEWATVEYEWATVERKLVTVKQRNNASDKVEETVKTLFHKAIGEFGCVIELFNLSKSLVDGIEKGTFSFSQLPALGDVKVDYQPEIFKVLKKRLASEFFTAFSELSNAMKDVQVRLEKRRDLHLETISLKKELNTMPYKHTISGVDIICKYPHLNPKERLDMVKKLEEVQEKELEVKKKALQVKEKELEAAKESLDAAEKKIESGFYTTSLHLWEAAENARKEFDTERKKVEDTEKVFKDVQKEFGSESANLPRN